MVQLMSHRRPNAPNQDIEARHRRLTEEAKRRRQAAMADYERRQNQAPQSVDSQFASVFTDTPSAGQNQAADTACSASDGGGGE